MPIKSVKMKISKNKKMRFFLMSKGSFDPKIRFIGQNVCSVARVHTDRQTDRHESEYRGHPFRVSGFFLQPIIKERSNLCFISIDAWWARKEQYSCTHKSEVLLAHRHAEHQWVKMYSPWSKIKFVREEIQVFQIEIIYL